MSVLAGLSRTLCRVNVFVSPSSLATTRLISHVPVRHMSVSPVSSSTHSHPHDLYDSESAFGYHSTDNLFENANRGSCESADPTGRSYAYLVSTAAAVGWMGFGRQAVNKFIATLSASADVMALASLEVDISAIEEGRAATVKWRGKPVFIRHRTRQEIESAHKDDAIYAQMRDPQRDAERVQQEKWIVLIGVCTHLGCVPINGSGDFGGWFCPCHGSHYDTSGRIRKGPAPLNLEVPQYKFITDTKLLLG